MKFTEQASIQTSIQSLPVWGAWIEMIYYIIDKIINTSLPVWGAWIEILNVQLLEISLMSLPVWGAWIEIC